MESKTKNTKTRQQIAGMAASAFGGMALADGDDAVVELKDGWFNAAYDIRLADGREVILKIAPPRGAEVMIYEKNIMHTEVAAMRLVRRTRRFPYPRSTSTTTRTTSATRTTSSWRSCAGTTSGT